MSKKNGEQRYPYCVIIRIVSLVERTLTLTKVIPNIKRSLKKIDINRTTLLDFFLSTTSLSSLVDGCFNKDYFSTGKDCAPLQAD